MQLYVIISKSVVKFQTIL